MKNSKVIITILGIVAVTLIIYSLRASYIQFENRITGHTNELNYGLETGYASLLIFLIIVLIKTKQLLSKTSSKAFKPPSEILTQDTQGIDPAAAKDLLSRVSQAEGFAEAEPGSYWDFIGNLVKNTDMEEANKRMLPFEFTSLFSREKPEFRMYVGHTQKLYVMLLLTLKELYPQNVIIRKDPKTSGDRFRISAIPFANPGAECAAPKYVNEFITRNKGNYPIGAEFDSIFIGKGGICVAAHETDKVQDVYNLIKFTRELAGLMEE